MPNSLTSGNREDFYKKILEIAKENHKPLSLRTLKRRAKFFFIANQHKQEIKNFAEKMQSQNITVTPQMLGVLEWPYIHNEWSIETKLAKLATHYEILSKPFPALAKINESEPYEIIDFDHISKGIKVLIDYAPWFIREGELVLNIFQNDLRVASIAFTLSYVDKDIVAYIGAIQGIHSGISTEESLEIYKTLTKDFEGLRPRSLLLEVLKVVLMQLNVKKIFAVSEQHRHHRHKYFKNNQKTVFKNDYNVFWEEHEGILDEATGFYLLPMTLSIKDMAEIPSKKRGMYKRRYEIIEFFKNTIDLSAAKA